LRPDQIAAAQRLFARMPGWKLAERTLDEIARRFPEFDDVACVAKVTTLNALYGTNVYALLRMAEHVRDVMAECGAAPKGADLVERLANLPVVRGTERKRRHISFASKFAHFFVDATTFPLFDQYAAATLAGHLGKANRSHSPAHPYIAYATDCSRLRDLAGFDGTIREMDRYLWLAGLRRASLKGKVVSGEAQALFAQTNGDVAADCALMCPAT
jgi:hypothetical protein